MRASPARPAAGRTPIMIGTTGERMLRLTARHAALWNAWGANSPDRIPALREKVDAACAAVGRDSATLERTVTVLIDRPNRTGRPPREKGPFLSGTPEEIAGAFRGYAREGITHIQAVLDPNTVAGIEALAPVLSFLDRG